MVNSSLVKQHKKVAPHLHLLRMRISYFHTSLITKQTPYFDVSYFFKAESLEKFGWETTAKHREAFLLRKKAIGIVVVTSFHWMSRPQARLGNSENFLFALSPWFFFRFRFWFLHPGALKFSYNMHGSFQYTFWQLKALEFIFELK